jgi:hypothetical protein
LPASLLTTVGLWRQNQAVTSPSGCRPPKPPFTVDVFDIGQASATDRAIFVDH